MGSQGLRHHSWRDKAMGCGQRAGPGSPCGSRVPSKTRYPEKASGRTAKLPAGTRGMLDLPSPGAGPGPDVEP